MKHHLSNAMLQVESFIYGEKALVAHQILYIWLIVKNVINKEYDLQ